MLAALLLAPLVAGASYPLVDSHKGSTFLSPTAALAANVSTDASDGWNTPASTYDNTTSGDVFWAQKGNSSLMYLNDAGRFVLKVDNTSFVPYNEKRYAPSLLSKRSYPAGTVWVMDAVHMPYGCSVWPAFWTQGAQWPEGGEIDIMEGVNGQTTNQMALHSDSDGCYASSSVEMTGSLKLDNCSVTANSGSGCTVGDNSTASYGEGFAAAGGGVYVCEFTDEFIKIWFKSRADVPAEMTGEATSLDTSILGTPTAYYPAQTCDIAKYFSEQILTITITLCGTWAGGQSTLEQTCPPLVGTNTCYTTYVINDASETYKNAYFELNYINVYSTGVSADSSSDNSSTTGTGSSGAAASSGAASSGNSSGARRNLDTPIARLGWAGAVAGAVAAGLAVVL